jgi:mRNA interferase MazF
VGKVRRGQVYLGQFNGVGSEIQKPRPCLVVSPDAMNARAATCIVVPMTTQPKKYPSRVRIEFGGRACFAMLDHVQAMSPVRVITPLGEARPSDTLQVLDRLSEMFAP